MTITSVPVAEKATFMISYAHQCEIPTIEDVAQRDVFYSVIDLLEEALQVGNEVGVTTSMEWLRKAMEYDDVLRDDQILTGLNAIADAETLMASLPNRDHRELMEQVEDLRHQMHRGDQGGTMTAYDNVNHLCQQTRRRVL